MLFQTTQAHEELRAKVRAFAEEEIKPIAFMLDQQNEFPDEAIRKLGEMGLMGIPFPAEYGGAGLDALSYAIAVEELARVDGGAGVILSAHVSLGSWPIFAYGTEEQKRKYLVPLAKGEKIGAFGLTEPNAGSDAGGTETTAVLKGDHYVLNGGKIFITNAPKADTYVVFAVTTPDIGTRGISAFIVEKGWKGFYFGDHYDKMGIRSSSTAELIFDNVEVPRENLLGKAGGILDQIRYICPLHGPVWRKDLGYFIDKYDKWSRYEPEVKGVLIVYASMYGNTEAAAQALAAKLCERGITDVALYDVSNTHVSYLIAESFKYSHIVLASVTYNLGIYPVMKSYLEDMKALNLQNRTFAIIENGSWACKSGDLMQAFIDEELKNMTVLNERLSLASSLQADKAAELDQLADALVESLQEDLEN